MSSVAYNITRKIEWMGRRLRHINEAGEIKVWVSAMSALNALLNVVDIKGSSDNWRPWKNSKDGVKDDLRKMESQSLGGSLASMKGMGTKKIVRRNKPFLSKVRPPRVQVEVEEVQMIDPKSSVMEMLKKDPLKETWSDSLVMESDGSEQEEATKVHSETNQHRELSLIEKKKNRDIWRCGMLERLKKENAPVEQWGDARSGNFRWLISECAPHAVRVAVIKDLGFNGTDKFLFTELRKFYDKG